MTDEKMSPLRERMMEDMRIHGWVTKPNRHISEHRVFN
jgi:hypothetical protein